MPGSIALAEPRIANRGVVAGGEVFLELAHAQDGLNPFVVQATGADVVGRRASLLVRAAKAGPAVHVTRGTVQFQGRDEALHASQQLEPGAAKPSARPRATQALTWLRDLMCAAEAPLVPPSDHAGGALAAVDPHRQEAKLTVRRFHVAVYNDYGAILEHFQSLADAMVALKLAPPADFLSRVIRAADRWRAVDNDPEAACQAPAKVLKRLGERDLAWDYATTPVALRPNEAGPWVGLAAALGKEGELELADCAHRAAAAAEPTDAQLLWDWAQNLERLGRHQDAQALLRRIAEGSWQPRFQGLQAQARHLLKTP